MARKFVAYSPYSSVGFDEAHIRSMFHYFLESGCMLVTEDGFICGALTPLVFAPHVKLAVEIAWWSEDGTGDELKAAFEEWAQKAGALGTQFSTLNNPLAPKLAQRLTDDGYTPVEVAYIKVF